MTQLDIRYGLDYQALEELLDLKKTKIEIAAHLSQKFPQLDKKLLLQIQYAENFDRLNRTIYDELFTGELAAYFSNIVFERAECYTIYDSGKSFILVALSYPWEIDAKCSKKAMKSKWFAQIKPYLKDDVTKRQFLNLLAYQKL